MFLRFFVLLLIFICAVIGCDRGTNLVDPLLVDRTIAECDIATDIRISGGKYIINATLDKPCADNILLENRLADDPNAATPEPINAETGIIDTTLNAIVNDTLRGGTSFEGKVVSITAEVEFVFDTFGESMTLETNNPDVGFFVAPSGDFLDAEFKTDFREGETYTLQLYIRHQESDGNALDKDVWSLVAEGQLRKTTLKAIVDNTRIGGNQFEGKIVEIQGQVDWISDDNDVLTLVSNDANISFYVSPTGDHLEGKFHRNFVEDRTYTFQLYIESQDLAGLFEISSYILK